jgi:nitrite reductase (NO-forming)
MRLAESCGVAALVVVMSACRTPPADTVQPDASASAASSAAVAEPVVAGAMAPLAGQRATCAGPATKTFALTAREAVVDVGVGTTVPAWTYDGRLPGPTLEVCEGDRVRIHLTNGAAIAHGLDTHALSIDARKYGPTEPGTTLVVEGVATAAGAFMYHCSAGPVTDVHIKSGMHGAMIVHPRTPLPPARELVVVEAALFGERDPNGVIAGLDTRRMQRNDAEFRTFNGSLAPEPVTVAAGDRVRVHFVNVGPGTAAAHVVGSLFDTVVDGSLVTRQVQTYAVPPGGGAVLDFHIPEAGEFVLVDHDQLGHLPWGFAVKFVTAP